MFGPSRSKPYKPHTPTLVAVSLVMLGLALLISGCAAEVPVKKPNGFKYTNGDSKAELTGLPTFAPTTWVALVSIPDGTTATYTVSVPVDSDTVAVAAVMVPDASTSGAVPSVAGAVHVSSAVAVVPGAAQTVSVPLVQSTTTTPSKGSTYSVMVYACNSATCSPGTTASGAYAYFTVNGVYVKMNPGLTSDFLITELTGQTVKVP
ncbi:MAG: hypothetical protein OEW39_12675 [Deltaproteobacteria bacterium]|nr:hypothetical protein [Deltaproteobacteria bacterium]